MILLVRKLFSEEHPMRQLVQHSMEESRYRNKKVIQAAQLTFLGIMLAGTFLMAASIKYQAELPSAFLNISCMAA